MKKAMTALAVFLGVEALLLLGTCTALGIELSEMLALRLLLDFAARWAWCFSISICSRT